MATNLDVEPLFKAEGDAKQNAFKRDRFNARRTFTLSTCLYPQNLIDTVACCENACCEAYAAHPIF